MQVWTVLGDVYHVVCGRGTLKRDFLGIYLSTFLDFVILEIENL